MDVFASDIEADKTEQYVDAKEALKTAIAKFDVLYGLKSPSSEEATPSVDDAEVPFVDAEVAEVTPVVDNAELPYDFASGNDPESLKKAKQAVEELKTLFADMKKQEAEVATQSTVSAPVSSAQEVVTQPGEVAMPTFVTPTTPVQPVETVVQEVGTLPTPMNTPAPAQDASEIDSILAELKKLQNKGTPQL
jgi:hypothetical protein